MKKLFTVLAVLLVASLAFAGFSGSVKAGYTFDFDNKTIDYAKPGFGKVDVTFGWDSPVYTVGEAEGTHIEFALSTNFKGFYNLSGDHAKGYDPFRDADAWTWVYKFEDDDRAEYVKAGINLKVDTFKIVGNNWEVSFVDSLGLDFAKSAIDSKKFNKYTLEENVKNFSMDNSLKGAHNLVATIAGYKVGFGLGAGTWFKEGDETIYENDWTDFVRFALTAVTPEYDFNGVKAQFGAGYQISSNTIKPRGNAKYYDDYKTYAFSASAKASYTSDKFSVSGAYDANLSETSKTDKDLYLLNDLAVKFDFAPVTVDVFFANDGAKAKDKYYNYLENTAGHELAKDPNYLSAKAVVDVARVAENVPVTLTLTGTNLINEDKQVLSVEAETTIVPNFKFGAYFNNWFDFDDAWVEPSDVDHRKLGATVEFTGVQNLTLNAEAAYEIARKEELRKLYLLGGASYAHELFTASASVALEKAYERDAVMGAIVGAKSTTLVAGAELSAKAFFNLNDLSGLDDDADNKLVLACKVTF